MKKLTILGFILVLPLFFNSCAKTLSNRSPLKDAVDAQSRVAKDTTLNYVIEHPDEFYAFGQAYVDTITDGESLYDYLLLNDIADAAAIWADPKTLADVMDSLYIVFVVHKDDPTKAELHVGANSTFVVFEGSLQSEFKAGTQVMFSGRDDRGPAVMAASYDGSKLYNISILIDSEKKQFALPQLTLEDIFK